MEEAKHEALLLLLLSAAFCVFKGETVNVIYMLSILSYTCCWVKEEAKHKACSSGFCCSCCYLLLLLRGCSLKDDGYRDNKLPTRSHNK